MRNVERESRAHVEVAVGLLVAHRSVLLDEAEDRRRIRRQLVDDVGEVAVGTHELAPAVPRHIDGVVDVDLCHLAEVDQVDVDVRWVEQHLAVCTAGVVDLSEVAVGELLGDLASHRVAVRVQPRARQHHDDVAVLDATRADDPFLGHDDAHGRSRQECP